MLDIHILHVNRALSPDESDKLSAYVSAEKRHRIGRFLHIEDAQRSLLGDIISRYAICKRLGIKNSHLTFGANEYGKPLLSSPPGIHFNISHSGNWVVCAADDAPVGIDVELIKPIGSDIAKRFFSQEEYSALMKQPGDMRLNYFYMLWTLKESYIKAEGKGLSIPLDSFSMHIASSGIYATANRHVEKYSFFNSFLDSRTILAVCTTNIGTTRRFDWETGSFLAEASSIL